MRQIILDTETTGLEPSLGHRIIEIAAVELLSRRFTDRHFHVYLNPDREIDEGAAQVHGLTLEFLQDKPHFADVVDEFIDYVHGAELIIHNAPFDVGFLDRELSLAGRGKIAEHCSTITDTLRMAKDLHPGQKNNLDALCKRYSVDNSARTLHGALVDAQLLAEVYLAMTRGQETLAIDIEPMAAARGDAGEMATADLVVVKATEDELALHESYLDALDKASRGQCLWRRLSSQGGD
ncbi:MAG: DNA polymerase III subunit epsilon [Betaproteobacteria bacterium]|nr:DNA polymerase III subunit epsilon [Betaproteobacteria bacterium]